MQVLHELRVHQLELEMQNEELRRAQKALEASRARYFDLYDLAPVGYFTLSRKGLLLEANLTFARLLGVARSALQKMPLSRFLLPEDHGRFYACHRQLFETRAPLSFELRLLRPDGSQFWARVEVTLAQEGEQKALVCHAAVNDLTEQKRAEQERLEMDRRLRLLHAQRLESLGVLAGGLAHDLNNILAIIAGNTSFARGETTAGSPGRMYLENVEKGVQRATELTRQMLAYAGKGKLTIEPVDLSRMAEDMGQLMKSSVSKKAELRFELMPGLPLVQADTSQLAQLLLNLILNASEALGDQAGEIRVKTGVMEVDRAHAKELSTDGPLPEGQVVYLEVTDTGCGMKPETMAKIFDPFFSTKLTGRGLGLSAVQGIVRGHQGVIRVESEPGQGSTFIIFLPASHAPAPAVAKEPPAPPEIDARCQGTILIAEDEEMIRTILQQYVEALGFRALMAQDGLAALEIYRAHRREITLVLLDYKMPRMDGVECLTKLRQLDPGVRAILSSGYPEEQAIAEHGTLGWAGFLQKPFDADRLKAKLLELLSPAGKEAG